MNLILSTLYFILLRYWKTRVKCRVKKHRMDFHIHADIVYYIGVIVFWLRKQRLGGNHNSIVKLRQLWIPQRSSHDPRTVIWEHTTCLMTVCYWPLATTSQEFVSDRHRFFFFNTTLQCIWWSPQYFYNYAQLYDYLHFICTFALGKDSYE